MQNWKPYAALAGLCFLWGTTYFGIRVGVQYFPVFLFSGVRFIISGLIVVLLFALLKKTTWPSIRELIRITISGTLIFTGGNLFLCIAEMTVPSSLAAMVNTAFPIWVVIITRLWNPDEKTPLLALIGIFVAFTGQWLIYHEQLNMIGNSDYLPGLVFLIIGVISGATGAVHMKKFPVNTNPVLTGGLQMLAGGLITTIIGIFRGEISQVKEIPSEGWLAMLYLILFGSIVGYSLFVYAMKSLPAAMVSVYAYVNPIVALWLGWMFLHESISRETVIAMIITLSGVYIVGRGMRRSAKFKVQNAK